MKIASFIIGEYHMVPRKRCQSFISGSAMAVFDINGYIGGMNEAGESAVPFGQFESTSNEEYKNLMASYLDKNVSVFDQNTSMVTVWYFRKINQKMHLATGSNKIKCNEK